MKRCLAGLALSLIVLAPGVSGQGGPNDRWVATWATASIARKYPPPSDTPPAAGAAPTSAAARALPLPNNQTLRQIVRTTIGGSRVRVTLTNAFGTTPLVVGAAHVALRDKDAAIVVASDRVLTFSGQKAITIPAGAIIVSDPVSLAIPPDADVVVDAYFPGDTSAQMVTIHRAAHQTSYLSAPGDHAGEADMASAAKVTAWYFLSDVEVAASDRPVVIVALGDSITEGTASTTDANHRWPDTLERRLMADRTTARTAVLNAGIAGNRLLSESIAEFGINILARFDRDVLLQPGVTHVVVMEGINDIGGARENASPSVADLIAAHQQLIDRAHSRGLKIVGATLTPIGGAAYFTVPGEQKRQALNEWIRTGKAYDGVIDFDAAVRDPQAPVKFLSSYDSGDHLHPNDAGYEAMGNAVNLRLFK